MDHEQMTGDAGPISTPDAPVATPEREVRTFSLEDKYLAESGPVYMTGIQVLVRLALEQKRLDRRFGLHTGGFISGYRGSPLAGYDQQLDMNKALLDSHDIHFTPAINEELGATAVWGSQKLKTHGQSDFDGVFGIWYGKAPGVDRAGDVLKHANVSGTARHGGVLAIAGDDPLAKSSTVACQSELALMDAEIPVLNPSDLQDVLDYGLVGFALSRYSGLWVGMIALADLMDASGVLNVQPERGHFTLPEDLHDPRRMARQNQPVLLSNRLQFEALVRRQRLPSAQAFVLANQLDKVTYGAATPRIGFVATGKAYRDLRQALNLLGVSEAQASAMGLGIYKVAMSWPLEPTGLASFAKGVETLCVVETKRAFMEPQIKSQAYHWPDGQRPAIYGKTRPDGTPFLSDIGDLAPTRLMARLIELMPHEHVSEDMKARVRRLAEREKAANDTGAHAKRMPYFCSGCPHNTSTKTPEGSRSMPGIGCHAMAEIPGRTSDGLVAMGGEGVPWLGQHMFAKDEHIFANLGDGTYYHSGILAIRAAIAAKVRMTYKILFNDAVAMTGGQPMDGPLDVPSLVRQMQAEGVRKLAVLSEQPEAYDTITLGDGIKVQHRDELPAVMDDCKAYHGVSVIIYDQTCAAEKRRRRKRGLMIDPPKRLFINERVCEDCGDCSVQSNCIAVEPHETDFGRKRVINQSSCNKDFSCTKGFCPSFVEVDGGEIVRHAPKSLDFAAMADALPAPERVPFTATQNLLITGIGGLGVTTSAAIIAMAAHLDGLNATTLDMTGLAQKNGDVSSHVRIAPAGQPIEGPRVPSATLDGVIAIDMLVAAGAGSLLMMAPDRTKVIGNSHIAPTAEFVMHRRQSYLPAALLANLKLSAQSVDMLAYSDLAEQLFGDAIFANMMMIGAAFQAGLIPVSQDAFERAIVLNGVAVQRNLEAFMAGRIARQDPLALTQHVALEDEKPAMTLEERIAFLADDLVAYQNTAYGEHYRTLAKRALAADRAHGHGDLRFARAVVENLYKVMAYKDEYEVARLYSDPAFLERLRASIAGGSIRIMLAPPFLGGTDPATGRPKKRAFGAWIFPVLKGLHAMRGLRGTWLDPFGYTVERRHERALVALVMQDIEAGISALETGDYDLLTKLARVSKTIKGYGPVKEEAYRIALDEREHLLDLLRAPKPPEADIPVAAE